MTPVGWRAVVTDWKALVRYHRGEFGRDELHRLVDRHGGTVEDTGGGIEVGFVRFTVAVGSEEAGDARLEDATATITDEMIALWIGDEPYVDLPAEEIFAAEVIG